MQEVKTSMPVDGYCLKSIESHTAFLMFMGAWEQVGYTTNLEAISHDKKLDLALFLFNADVYDKRSENAPDNINTVHLLELCASVNNDPAQVELMRDTVVILARSLITQLYTALKKRSNDIKFQRESDLQKAQQRWDLTKDLMRQAKVANDAARVSYQQVKDTTIEKIPQWVVKLGYRAYESNGGL